MKIKWFRFFLCLLFVLCSKAGFSQNVTGGTQTKLSLQAAELTTAQNFEDWNFGISIFSQKLWKYFPCQFKAGNLTAGGGISKLNNPLLSTSVSPFSTANTTVTCVTASLPGISTFSKPVSYFGELGFSNKKTLLNSAKVNLFYCPENSDPFFSTQLGFSPCKKIEFAAAFTGGCFSYKENNFPYWFTDSDFYFQSGKHFCLNSQFAAAVPHFKTLFSVSTYKTPFGNFQNIYKSESKINLGHFIFNFSAVYNEHKKLLTSNETSIPDCFQTKTSIQTNFAVGKRFPLFLKTGIAAFYNFKLSEEESPLKIAYGNQLTSAVFSASIITTASFTVSESEKSKSFLFNSAGLELKNSVFFRSFTPGLSLGFTISPSKDYETVTSTQKIGFTLAALKNPKLSCSNSLSFTQKNNVISKRSLSSSVTAGWKIKKLTVSGKLALSIQSSD